MDARPPIKLLLGTLLCGFAFGALTSAVNGAGVAFLVPVSLVLGVGWSWAALAFIAGSLAHSAFRSATSSTIILIAATCGYYLMNLARGGYVNIDPVIPGKPNSFSIDWSSFWSSVAFWSLFALIVGPILGLAGLRCRRPGIPGTVCLLTIPAIAIAEMIYRLRNDLNGTERDAARIATWSTTLAAAVIVSAIILTTAMRRVHRHPVRRK